MSRYVDDRPKNWESPDGRSFWYHYAHEQDRRRSIGQPEWWRVVAVTALLAGALFLFCSPAKSAPPPEPYAGFYSAFHDRVAHGLTAKMYVGVRPAKGEATRDDLWLPPGSFGLVDGVYDCRPHRGKAVFKMITPAVKESPRPFVPGPDTTPATPAHGAEPPTARPTSSAGTRAVTTYTPARTAVRSGSTSGCST